MMRAIPDPFLSMQRRHWGTETILHVGSILNKKFWYCSLLVLNGRYYLSFFSWLEQDPYELVESVRECITVVMDKVKGRGITSSLIRGIGITNQRETSILWDKTTGKCFCNNIG